jgi:hypothetical protein
MPGLLRKRRSSLRDGPGLPGDCVIITDDSDADGYPDRAANSHGDGLHWWVPRHASQSCNWLGPPSVRLSHFCSSRVQKLWRELVCARFSSVL